MSTNYKVYFQIASNGILKAYRLTDGIGKRVNMSVEQAKQDIAKGIAQEVKPFWA